MKSAPFLAWFLTGRLAVAVPVTLMAGVLIYRHKANIQKLLAGTESRIGGKKAAAG